jgi:anti-anti-sigma factor
VELTLEVQCRDEKPILHCQGHLICGHESEALLAAIARLLANSEQVVIDLENVRKVDCAGIGVLAAAVSVAHQHGKIIELCSVPEKVRCMMQMTGLQNVLNVAKPARRNEVVAA